MQRPFKVFKKWLGLGNCVAMLHAEQHALHHEGRNLYSLADEAQALVRF